MLQLGKHPFHRRPKYTAASLGRMFRGCHSLALARRGWDVCNVRNARDDIEGARVEPALANA